MKASRSKVDSGRISNHVRSVALLLFVFPLPFGTWQSSSRVAQGQTAARVPFTESLKFQEIEPGIEYGQTTTGHASKDETTGPWFINVLRIDLSRATLKIVHALDEGVGLETVSSIAARYRAPAATNGGYFWTTGAFTGEPLGLLMLERHLLSEPYKDRAEFGLIEPETKRKLFLVT